MMNKLDDMELDMVAGGKKREQMALRTAKIIWVRKLRMQLIQLQTDSRAFSRSSSRN